jgi:hypothetical protein
MVSMSVECLLLKLVAPHIADFNLEVVLKTASDVFDGDSPKATASMDRSFNSYLKHGDPFQIRHSVMYDLNFESP